MQTGKFAVMTCLALTLLAGGCEKEGTKAEAAKAKLATMKALYEDGNTVVTSATIVDDKPSLTVVYLDGLKKEQAAVATAPVPAASLPTPTNSNATAGSYGPTVAMWVAGLAAVGAVVAYSMKRQKKALAAAVNGGGSTTKSTTNATTQTKPVGLKGGLDGGFVSIKTLVLIVLGVSMALASWACERETPQEFHQRQVSTGCEPDQPAQGVMEHITAVPAAAVASVADASRRGWAYSNVNPANGTRGGPTSETMYAGSIYVMEDAHNPGRGYCEMLLLNTETKSFELFRGRCVVLTEPTKDDPYVTIKVIEGLNQRGMPMVGHTYQGSQVSTYIGMDGLRRANQAWGADLVAYEQQASLEAAKKAQPK